MRTFKQKTSGGPRLGAAALRALRARLDDGARGEDGFLLIEVMISAMLVALIAVGTFTAFDVSGRIAANERAHQQATALAQQDQERLRGLSAEELSSLSESKELTVQKTHYTVVSKSQFVSDTAGTSSCSSAGASADYYETTSEVKWSYNNINKNLSKVVETGLVAPPAGGELSVTINDGRGGKVSGMSISGSGPQSFSATTGSNGCVIFGPLEEGEYTLHATQTGYVNEQGESDIKSTERSITTTGQTTSSKEWPFNKAGFIKAGLETKPTSFGSPQTFNVIVTETGLTLGYRKLLAAEAGYVSGPITSPTNFFPFQNGYQQAFAGSCLANNPEKYGVSKTEIPKVQLEPGAEGVPTIGGTTKSLVEPAMLVLFYKGTKTTEPLVEKPEIYIKETDSECNNTTYKFATFAKPEKAKGDLEQPGLPYGKYTVCALFTNSKSEKKYVVKENVENKNTTSGTPVELFEGSSEAKSGTKCP